MANHKRTSVQRDHSHISFRLPKSQLDAMRERAKQEDRSLAAEVRRAVTAHLKQAA